MFQHICVVCNHPITTSYSYTFKHIDSRHSEKVYTCNQCIIIAAVEKFLLTGVMEHRLTEKSAEISAWPQVAAQIEEARLNLGLAVLALQKAISMKMVEHLFDNEGEYSGSSYPLYAQFTNHGGSAEISFYQMKGDVFSSVSFYASECNPNLPWKLSSFSGSKASLDQLIKDIIAAIQGGEIEFRWVIPGE